MPWWGWLIIGIFLMGAELGAVDAAFYLVFAGFAAIVVGLLGLFGIDFAVWEQWLLFSVLALLSMYLFRDRLYKKFRGEQPDYEISEVGELIRVPEDVAPGGSVRVEMRGSRWTALNVSDVTIAAGSEARVLNTRGLKIDIAPRESSQTT